MASHYPPSWYIVGQRGGGKSSLVQALCAHWRVRGLYLGIVDPVHEFAVPPHGRRYRLQTKMAELVDSYPDGPPLWEAAARACRDALTRQNMSVDGVVILDDANMVCSGPGVDDAPRELKLVVHEGRHARTGFLASIRRPSETPRWLSSEATHRAVFAMTEDADLQVLRRRGAGYAEHLERGEFLHRVTGRGPSDPWGRWHLHRDALDADGNLWPCLLAR